MIYFENTRTDPTFNLAAEEFLLSRPHQADDGDKSVFLLWQNAPSVILGRNQNAFEEVNLPLIQERGIAVIRRLSGGGAVYHDLGNLNFSFIVPNDTLRHSATGGPDFEFFTQPVAHLLKRLGLAVEFSGRNDLALGGKKFSGNAQVRSGGRLLHHGTLLFSTDIEAMTAVLHVTPDKFISKGVTSVRSRVTNLADHLAEKISIGDFKNLLRDEIATQHPGDFTIRPFSPEETAAVQRLQAERYTTRNWNFGKSPKSNFRTERRFPWGKLQIHLLLERGFIADAAFSGDFFTLADPDAPERLARKFVGLVFSPAAITAAVSEETLRSVFPGLTLQDFLMLLFS